MPKFEVGDVVSWNLNIPGERLPERIATQGISMGPFVVTGFNVIDNRTYAVCVHIHGHELKHYDRVLENYPVSEEYLIKDVFLTEARRAVEEAIKRAKV